MPARYDPGPAVAMTQPYLVTLTRHLSQSGFYFNLTDITPDSFDSFLHVLFPRISNKTRDVIHKLSPPAPGDQTGERERVTDMIGDIQFTCNGQFLATAFSAGAAYRYIFGIGTAVHGSNVPFTFDAPSPTTVLRSRSGRSLPICRLLSPALSPRESPVWHLLDMHSCRCMGPNGRVLCLI